MKLFVLALFALFFYHPTAGAKTPDTFKNKAKVEQDSKFTDRHASRAIVKAEELIDRFVTTPAMIRDRASEQQGQNWDSIELVDQQELTDGKIEYTLRYSSGAYSTEVRSTVSGPRNVVVDILGPADGPTANLSAHDAKPLVAKCREWYNVDPHYCKIVNLIEEQVVAKINYDWTDFFDIEKHTDEEALALGVGLCGAYAKLAYSVLHKAGYKVEIWSSLTGKHAWNHVILPDGKTLYVDCAWYDNIYENNPQTKDHQAFSPYFVTYDKQFFEHSHHKNIDMHCGWKDSYLYIKNY
ncbi:hypothetical protein FACS1894159_02430 [Bacteroidia bacterium]|nr:hypothetical protein FACS1894159_02430 [Bacteroidia bacterium]